MLTSSAQWLLLSLDIRSQSWADKTVMSVCKGSWCKPCGRLMCPAWTVQIFRAYKPRAMNTSNLKSPRKYIVYIVTVLSNRWHNCDFLKPWFFVSSLQINWIAFNPVMNCLMIIKFVQFQTVFIRHHFISMMNGMRRYYSFLIRSLELCSHEPINIWS